ncbi:hypothetical protein EGN72_14840 [Pseudorhodobacter sp. E13]|uniref:hypothetical protein n=1 Tax=Pseudorhodobacter sp. E13 TaxID=2487931 RepID=UPI000F8E7B41|nr:hypothetical protein [Pseudorhodobacter sp. E13]RUS59221.1 hypothetical protein EGN72_14840 [Pseudorhodobacter sp. E13]
MLNTAAYGLAWVAVLVVASIAAVCIPNPQAGLRKLDHAVEALPNVMLGRYLAFTGFTAFVAWFADLRVIAAWSGALAFMAFADTFIYARLGRPYLKHLLAGLAALAILAVVLAALILNGAA